VFDARQGVALSVDGVYGGRGSWVEEEHDSDAGGGMSKVWIEYEKTVKVLVGPPFYCSPMVLERLFDEKVLSPGQKKKLQ
jgi:hypothetical protein